MTGLPDINTLIQVVVNKDISFRSRIEDVDKTTLTISVPPAFVNGEVIRSRSDLEVFWTKAESRYRLRARIAGRTGGRLGRWQLVAISKPERCNRRRFVRANINGKVDIISRKNNRPQVLVGVIVDIGEGGLRCRVNRGGLAVGDQITANITISGQTIVAKGKILTIRPELRGKGIDVIISYTLPEREAQMLRRHILQWQINQRHT